MLRMEVHQCPVTDRGLKPQSPFWDLNRHPQKIFPSLIGYGHVVTHSFELPSLRKTAPIWTPNLSQKVSDRISLQLKTLHNYLEMKWLHFFDLQNNISGLYTPTPQLHCHFLKTVADPYESTAKTYCLTQKQLPSWI